MLRAVGLLVLPITVLGFSSEELRTNYCARFNWRRCSKRRLCRWEGIKSDENGGGECKPLTAEHVCNMFTPELSNQKRCREQTLGACLFDKDQNKCTPRSMTDDCQPCVGTPQDICGTYLKSRDCKRRIEGQACDWVGWGYGYNCDKDWRTCEHDELDHEKRCTEDSWGGCRWNNFEQTCKVNDEFPNCEPCRGPGVCTTIINKKVCDSSFGQKNGCEWRGWLRGDFCSDKAYGYRCWTVGDPHIHPFEPSVDKMTFMGIGDYWFTDAPTLQVQVRQQETREAWVTSNLAVAWFGPEYSCDRGTRTCSNTCGYTYELHAGHRIEPRKDKTKPAVTVGPHEFDPTLIVHNVDGASPEYWVYEGQEAIIEELTNGRCKDMMRGEKVAAEKDNLALRFYDGTTVRLARWDHPEWGLAWYLFLRDKGTYDYFNPPASGQMDALCNSKCNPVSCGSESFFTYYPDPQYAGDAEMTNRYAGVSRPYADFRNKSGWCEAFEQTECGDRPDPVDECPEELRSAAENLCKDVCDEATTQDCIFDACVAGDLDYALEYVETCSTVVTPAEAPVPMPTYDPTPSPTDVQCAAIYSLTCQQSSNDCGTLGGQLNGIDKFMKPLFTMLMKPHKMGTDSCSCEQFCMIKGGKWWKFTAPKEIPTSYELNKVKYFQWSRNNKEKNAQGGAVCDKFRPAQYGTCDCYWPEQGKGITKGGNKVKKNKKNFGRDGRFWVGEVKANHIEI